MRDPRRPAWCAVAPGRVNLMGDHIDYNGLSVLPMALERDVRIFFDVAEEPVVRLSGAKPEFSAFELALTGPVTPGPAGHWSNYVRAAASGLLEHGLALARGIEGTVVGTVPIASGLSSSSALVVASALALLKANGATVEPLELARLLAVAERLVGLQGGGMDQAVCLHGVRGHALRIDFEPLRVTPVRIPATWHWIVASSLVPAEKSGGAMEAYNRRARECAAALEGVAAALGRPRPATYGDLLGATSVEELLVAASEALEGVLFRRFRHVTTEGRRVEEGQRAMEAGELGAFGSIMTTSHESLRDDYDVSTVELDEMVDLATGAGAAGARLTGAGFGGCMVALCRQGDVPGVVGALQERFYGPRLGSPAGPDVLFEARAAGGASVVPGP